MRSEGCEVGSGRWKARRAGMQGLNTAGITSTVITKSEYFLFERNKKQVCAVVAMNINIVRHRQLDNRLQL